MHWLLVLCGLARVLIPASHCTVSGTVVDSATGDPVAGAEVRIDLDPTSYPCDELGRFTIPAIAGVDEKVLWWTAPGHCRPEEPHSVIVSPGAAITGVELPLIRVPELRIRVESKGQPVSGATVLLGAEAGMKLPNPDSGVRIMTFARSSFARTTNIEGEVLYDRLDLRYAKGLFVVVHCDGFDTATQELRWSGKIDQTLRVRLHKAPARRLVIRSGDRPLEGGSVVFFDRTPRWHLDDHGGFLQSPYAPDVRSSPIGAGGVVELHASRWPRYALVLAPSIGARLVDLEALPGTRERECTVRPGPTWEGRFVDREGKPIAGLGVRMQPDGGGSAGARSPSASTGPCYAGTTDEDGRISFPRVEEARNWTKCRIGVESPWTPQDRDDLLLTPALRTIVLVPREEPFVAVRMILPAGAPESGSIHLRGRRWSRQEDEASATLRERHQEFLAEPTDRRPTLPELERWARKTLKSDAMETWRGVIHAPLSGRWPVRSVEDHLIAGGILANDVIESLDGPRALLWGIEIPSAGSESDSAAATPVVEVRFTGGE